MLKLSTMLLLRDIYKKKQKKKKRNGRRVSFALFFPLSIEPHFLSWIP